jgi:pimeloyl-ACP methyl ester carboxylesterase
MKNLRKYGKGPFSVAVIHGGPGAAGEMAPVARELSSHWGVLEPLQTAKSLEGQVEELKEVLEQKGSLPVTLMGFSWGAWLSYIFTADNPTFVKKLILIDSGGFEDKYAENIRETRLSRLSKDEREEVESLVDKINDPAYENKNKAFAKLGKLFSKADAYEAIKVETEAIDCQYNIFRNVWREASELRSSGKFLELGKKIECSVVAIHGDYDPHTAEGVRKPLSGVVKDFRFILLKKSGHKPWIERYAKDEFYRILKEELS